MESTEAWIVWLAMFFLIEGDALFRKDHASTLTAHIRKWASLDGKPSGWRIRRFGLLAGVAWASAHLLLQEGLY